MRVGRLDFPLHVLFLADEKDDLGRSAHMRPRCALWHYEIVFQRGTSGFPSTCIISRRYKKMSGEGALICAECAHAQYAY